MRLLITTDTVGGVWTFTEELSAALLGRGHAVSLVSFGRLPSPTQAAWVDATRSTHPNRFAFTPSTAPLEWMQENEASFEAGEAILHTAAAHFRPDFLLSNQFCFGASTLDLPRVVAAHSDVLSWARAAEPSALSGSPWLNRYTALVQRGLLQANVVTAPTQSVVRGLKNSFFLPTNGIVIPNGRTLPSELEQTPTPPRLLQAVVAGRLWDQAKGLRILADTPLPLPILLAGETSHEGQTADPNLPGVQFLGQLTPSDLRTLYRESALYLCPSLYEPFGLAPLEAALGGCALVCRDLPSLREVWGDNALYFRTPAEMAAHLNRLAADPAALAGAGARAQAHARQYTPDRMTDAYLAVFAAVLDVVLSKSRVPHVA